MASPCEMPTFFTKKVGKKNTFLKKKGLGILFLIPRVCVEG